MCCDTENFQLMVTPSTLISLTLGIVGTAGEEITTAREHFSDTFFIIFFYSFISVSAR